MRAGTWIAVSTATVLLAAAPVGTPVGTAATTPSVTVSPASDLLDGQVVHVTGAGGSAGSFVSVDLCASGSTGFETCAVGTRAFPSLDADGAFAIDLLLEAASETHAGAELDCRVAPGCELQTSFFDTGTTVVTPLAFRPDAPLLPPPTIAASPATDLVDGTIVHVTGAGFGASQNVEVLQCTAGALDRTGCDQTGFTVSADTSGAINADLDVAALIEGFGTPVDCRSAACELVASRGSFTFDARRVARAALAFRPDGPLRPPPVVTVTPATALVDGQSVQVEGTGFRPSTFVSFVQCTPTGDVFERCGFGDAFTRADSTGAASASVTVHSLVARGGAITDCRVAPGCSLGALGFQDLLAEVPLEFDRSGPAPVLPTVAVATPAPLPERSLVDVTGSGFEPDSFVGLSECRLEDGLPVDCGPVSGYASADAEGDLQARVLLTSVHAASDGVDVDCRSEQCAIVASPFARGLPGFATLDFGPPARQRGRYLEQVFADVEMTGGIVYRQTTDSQGRAVDLALDVYQPAGDTETRRPAVMLMFGGYFGSGSREQLSDLAKSFARRGFVAFAIDYRIRPEIFSDTPGCIPVGGACLDPEQLFGAISDARDDGRAALTFIQDHADEYGIDARAVSAMGWSAGAITALNLAHHLGEDDPTSGVPAAAISMAGLLLADVQPDDPPSLMFAGNHDSLLPFTAQASGCASIRAGGATCDFVGYAAQQPLPADDACVAVGLACTYVLGRDEDHGIPYSERVDIVARTSEFLAEHVLGPLGMLHRPPIAVAGGPYVVNEGRIVHLDARGSSSPEGERLSFAWTGAAHIRDADQAQARIAGRDDARFPVTLTVTDASGASTSATARVRVRNVAPTVDDVDLIRLGRRRVLVVAPFRDPGRRDTHLASVDWGDGSVTPGFVVESRGRGWVVGVHRYRHGGRVTASVTVRDDDGGTTVASGHLRHL